ncbi:MAG: PspA/IM30 family protein [Chloroflexia bacterium]
MGILERLSTLIRANINDMLDSAEDPEVMLNQILRDMEGEIGKARKQVTEMMAQEKLYKDDLKAEQDKAGHMEERAMHYVRMENDAMAREALKRKADSDANIAVLHTQLQGQTDMVTRLRGQLDALDDKYKEALNNRDGLLARYRRVEARKQVDNVVRDLDVTDYSSELGRMERRIRMDEARVGASAELDQANGGDDTASKFDSEEHNSSIDADLAALKAKMNASGQ